MIQYCLRQPISIRSYDKNVKKLIGKGEPCFGEIPYRSGENMSLVRGHTKSQRIFCDGSQTQLGGWWAEKNDCMVFGEMVEQP